MSQVKPLDREKFAAELMGLVNSLDDHVTREDAQNALDHLMFQTVGYSPNSVMADAVERFGEAWKVLQGYVASVDPLTVVVEHDGHTIRVSHITELAVVALAAINDSAKAGA